jgi:hypothetical protein
MGGNTSGARAVLIAVGDPGRSDEIARFLRRVDYEAELVNGQKIEASPPEEWPDRLALTALEHFLAAWRRANPGVDVQIEDASNLDDPR